MRISIKVNSNFKTQLLPQNKINRSDHTNFKIELNTNTDVVEYTICSRLSKSKINFQFIAMSSIRTECNSWSKNVKNHIAVRKLQVCINKISISTKQLPDKTYSELKNRYEIL